MAQRAEEADRLGTAKPESVAQPTNAEAHAAGKADVESGRVKPEELVRKLASEDRAAKPQEYGAILEGRRRLLNEINAKAKAVDAAVGTDAHPQALADYEAAKARAAEFDSHLDRVKGASGGSLQSLKVGTTLNEGDFAQVVREAERSKGGKLDPKVEAQLKAQADALTAKEARINELETQATQRDAQANLAKPPRTKRTIAAIRQDRAAAVNVFKTRTVAKETEELAAQGIHLHNTGVRLLTEDQAKAIVTIAKSYAEEGIVRLADVTAKVREHVKTEAGFDLSDEDVHNALTGRYERSQKTPRSVSEGAQQIHVWKKELKTKAQEAAKLRSEASKSEQSEIDRLTREALGEERKLLKEEKSRLAESRRLQESADKAATLARRQEIREALSEDARATREAASRVLREEGQVRAKAARDLRDRAREEARNLNRQRKAEYEKVFGETSRLQKSIEDLQAKIQNGDFKGKPKAPQNPELDRLRFERDRLRQQVRQTIEAQKPRSTFQKAATVVRDVANIPRALKTTFDLSAPLRQGLVLSTANPKVAARAFAEQLRAFGNEAYAHAANKAILEGESAHLYKKAGLYLSNPESGAIGEHEEAFLSRFVGKIPGVANSERAYTTYLNTLRAGVFDNLTGGKNLSGEDLKAIANFINIATGRGPLGPFEKSANGLASILFSPRYLTSRFALPFTPLRKASPAVRAQITKQLATYVGSVYAFTKIAEAAGAEVSKDPTSSDFMKIKMGNTRIDALGGMQSALVLSGRMAYGKRTSPAGKVQDLNAPKFGGATRLSTVEDFARGKLNPAAGYVANWLNGGKDAVGQKQDAADTLKDFFTPLIANDFYESIQAQGVPKGIALGIASGLGLGVSTQAPKGEAPPQFFDYLASKVRK